VAFGLNMSALNDKNNKLNLYITQALEGVNNAIMEPFFGYNPKNFFKVREIKTSIQRLREYAKERILQRIKDMENNNYVVDDILSLIFKTAS
jgi:hypothetical protein